MKYMYWIFISVGATPLNDALNASSLAEGWFRIILELCLWKAIIVQYILYMLKSGNCQYWPLPFRSYFFRKHSERYELCSRLASG